MWSEKRAKDGLSYQQVAERIGMHYQQVYEILSGQVGGITMANAVDISRALHVDIRKAFPDFSVFPGEEGETLDDDTELHGSGVPPETGDQQLHAEVLCDRGALDL